MLEIIKHFGTKNQLKKLNEEVYEFIEATIELDKNHMEEELADVYVVLGGFIKLFDLNKENIKKTMNYKVKRTKERIKTGYYEKI